MQKSAFMNSSAPGNPGMPHLNFPPVRLRARRRGDAVEIWDGLRGIYLVLTPEEWVRQHLIAYLVSACGVLAKRIVEEHAVALTGSPSGPMSSSWATTASRFCSPSARRPTCRLPSGRWRRPCATIRCSVRGGLSSPTGCATSAGNTATGATLSCRVFPICPWIYRFLKLVSM